MRTEISLANTFLDVSETSRESAKQEQGRQDATTVYRSVLHYLPKLRLTAEESLDLASGVEALRCRLLAAGVAV